MRGALKAVLAAAALSSACLITGCNKTPEPTALPPGTPVTGSATAPGVPKQGSANAAMEAPVAAPSGVQPGNTAGGLK